jgi:SPP1 family predicted phage head-tail adaptor
MGIGSRQQVQLIQVLTVKAAAGNWTENVEGLKFGVWAEISNPSGFRDYQNGQTQLGTTKRFKIRFRFDKFPNADWKIRYDEKEWTISTKGKLDEKRFYWLITAQSKADV